MDRYLRHAVVDSKYGMLRRFADCGCGRSVPTERKLHLSVSDVPITLPKNVLGLEVIHGYSVAPAGRPHRFDPRCRVQAVYPVGHRCWSNDFSLDFLRQSSSQPGAESRRQKKIPIENERSL